MTQIAAANNQTAVVTDTGELLHWGAPQPDEIISSPAAIVPFGIVEDDGHDRYVSSSSPSPMPCVASHRDSSFATDDMAYESNRIESNRIEWCIVSMQSRWHSVTFTC